MQNWHELFEPFSVYSKYLFRCSWSCKILGPVPFPTAWATSEFPCCARMSNMKRQTAEIVPGLAWCSFKKPRQSEVPALSHPSLTCFPSLRMPCSLHGARVSLSNLKSGNRLKGISQLFFCPTFCMFSTSYMFFDFGLFLLFFCAKNGLSSACSICSLSFDKSLRASGCEAQSHASVQWNDFVAGSQGHATTRNWEHHGSHLHGLAHV